jgi:hypothetical protein
VMLKCRCRDGAMMAWWRGGRDDKKAMSERMITDSIILQKRAAHDKTRKIHLWFQLETMTLAAPNKNLSLGVGRYAEKAKVLGNIYYHECYHEQESITIIIDQKRL